MSTTELVELVGGIIAIGLAAIQSFRTGAISLTDAAVIVLGVVFVLVAVL